MVSTKQSGRRQWEFRELASTRNAQIDGSWGTGTGSFWLRWLGLSEPALPLILPQTALYSDSDPSPGGFPQSGRSVNSPLLLAARSDSDGRRIHGFGKHPTPSRFFLFTQPSRFFYFKLRLRLRTQSTVTGSVRFLHDKRMVSLIRAAWRYPPWCNIKGQLNGHVSPGYPLLGREIHGCCFSV